MPAGTLTRVYGLPAIEVGPECTPYLIRCDGPELVRLTKPDGTVHTVERVTWSAHHRPHWRCDCKGFAYRGKCRHVEALAAAAQQSPPVETTLAPGVAV